MLNRIIKIITLGFLILAIGVIWKEIKIVGVKSIINLIQNTPFGVIGIACIGIIINYFILSGYDELALCYIGKKLTYKNVLKASSISFAFSNTTGHTYAAGGAIRYWFYVPQGIPKMDILKMVLFETLTILIGIGGCFILAISQIPWENTISANKFFFMACGVGILLILYIREVVIPQKKIHIKNMSLPAPSIKMTVKQIIIGFADNITLFLIFYTFLRYHISAPIIESFTVFMIALSAGFITQVPGGLGVFEGTFLFLFPHETTQKSGILASLILFRIFYYFMPFLMAMSYLGTKSIMKKLFNT
ncbi:MAG: lysylphosphatidylglycerol synthase domain-containing protein [Pseudomonadota bacterium]|nr:lysylphosphatidylglycerol synthase domain-containing protein [Pseudomonadota bacterium]